MPARELREIARHPLAALQYAVAREHMRTYDIQGRRVFWEGKNVREGDSTWSEDLEEPAARAFGVFREYGALLLCMLFVCSG